MGPRGRSLKLPKAVAPMITLSAECHSDLRPMIPFAHIRYVHSLGGRMTPGVIQHGRPRTSSSRTTVCGAREEVDTASRAPLFFFKSC